MQDKLLIATNNPGKTAEFRELLSPLVGVALVTPDELGLRLDPVEDAADYCGNAAIKARAFYQAGGIPCLADDSGLEVDALGRAPGLRSARFGGLSGRPDAERRRLLLDLLREFPLPWRARFVCCLAFAPGEQDMLTWEGVCRGEIIPSERGEGGFGYDPIFLVEGTRQTMAELPMAEKNRISHRARAVRAGLAEIVARYRTQA
jgi:XTP/dITP diphosphohydrolase